MIKILHLSDLHIGIKIGDDNGAANKDFHEKLLAFICETFSKGHFNYVIISGDLGDRCIKTIDDAGIWLSKLQKGLNIDKRRILVCAGNHDMNTSFLKSNHDSSRLNFELGRNYVLKDYDDRVFELYSNTLKKSIDYVEKTIYDFPDLRFVVLNSSWLSQFCKESAKKEKEKLNEKLHDPDLRKDALEELYAQYGAVISSVDDLSDAYNYTLNYSENTRQQIVLYNKYKESSLDKIQKVSDKPTFLIFHHPEDHLHSFEKYQINGMEGTGNYLSIANNSGAKALVCGHIHPKNKRPMAEYAGEHLQMLIGAAGHIDPVAPYRPIFYAYEIDETSLPLNGTRFSYFWDDEKKAVSNPESDNLFSTIERKEGNNYHVIPSLQLNNEIDFIKQKQEIKNNIGNLIFEQLGQILPNDSIKRSFHYSWIQVKSSHYQFLHDIITYTINESVKISVDIIFCDDNPDSLLTRTRCLSRLNDSLESDIEKYYPIFIDTLNGYVESHHRNIYLKNKSSQFENLKKTLKNDTNLSFESLENYTLKRLIEDLGVDINVPIGEIFKIDSFDKIGFTTFEELIQIFSKKSLDKQFNTIFQ